MNCPFCQHPQNEVVDSRLSTLNNTEGTRRRRECLSCHQRFSTFEYICEIPRGNVPRNVFHPGYDPIAKKNGTKNGAPKTDLKNKVKQALIRAKQRYARELDKLDD